MRKRERTLVVTQNQEVSAFTLDPAMRLRLTSDTHKVMVNLGKMSSYVLMALFGRRHSSRKVAIIPLLPSTCPKNASHW